VVVVIVSLLTPQYVSPPTFEYQDLDKTGVPLAKARNVVPHRFPALQLDPVSAAIVDLEFSVLEMLQQPNTALQGDDPIESAMENQDRLFDPSEQRWRQGDGPFSHHRFIRFHGFRASSQGEALSDELVEVRDGFVAIDERSEDLLQPRWAGITGEGAHEGEFWTRRENTTGRTHQEGGAEAVGGLDQKLQRQVASHGVADEVGMTDL
jgi:hypothetical protein